MRSYPQVVGDYALNGMQLLNGFLLAMGIAILGYLGRALSWDGALAAVLVGGVTFGIGGFLPAVLLILFFITSSLLTKLGKTRKRSVVVAFAKGGRRDYGQVLANGGLAAILAALYGISGQTGWLLGLSGALAAVNADTWATELGVLARRWPRLITSWTRVEPGTSGGVTLEGTLAGLGGAAVIAFATGLGKGKIAFVLPIVIGGMIGAFLDSVMGATVQSIYYCPTCDKQTERHPLHICGTKTEQLRGWHWLNNDGVNFIASVLGASSSLILWWIFR
jgi:uncharacterized protein (TIGR00297 family)